MIRFVDLRGQGIVGGRFAFFNTTTDRFLSMGGDQVWLAWSEVVMDARFDVSCGTMAPEMLDRLRLLCPDWAFESPDGDEFWDDDPYRGFEKS